MNFYKEKTLATIPKFLHNHSYYFCRNLHDGDKSSLLGWLMKSVSSDWPEFDIIQRLIVAEINLQFPEWKSENENKSVFQTIVDFESDINVNPSQLASVWNAATDIVRTKYSGFNVCVCNCGGIHKIKEYER